MEKRDFELLNSFTSRIDQIPFESLEEGTFATTFVRFGVASVLIDLAAITQALSEEAIHALPDVPWNSVVAIRNVLAHQPEGVDYSKVWAAVEDLPRVQNLIATFLQEECP